MFTNAQARSVCSTNSIHRREKRSGILGQREVESEGAAVAASGRDHRRHTRARTNPPGRAEQLEEQGRSVAAMASALERSVDLGDVQLLRAEVGRWVGGPALRAEVVVVLYTNVRPRWL